MIPLSCVEGRGMVCDVKAKPEPRLLAVIHHGTRRQPQPIVMDEIIKKQTALKV